MKASFGNGVHVRMHWQGLVKYNLKVFHFRANFYVCTTNLNALFNKCLDLNCFDFITMSSAYCIFSILQFLTHTFIYIWQFTSKTTLFLCLVYRQYNIGRRTDPRGTLKHSSCLSDRVSLMFTCCNLSDK